MKKLLVSLFTVVAFVGYAAAQRVTGQTTSPLSPPPTQSAQMGSAPQATPPSQGSGAGAGSNAGAPTAYRNGTYTGGQADTQWGPVQVQVSISNGRISSVQFLEFPQDRRRSVAINSQAVPILQQEAIQAQSAQVDLISGATLTSEGFAESLQSALSQAA